MVIDLEILLKILDRNGYFNDTKTSDGIIENFLLV